MQNKLIQLNPDSVLFLDAYDPQSGEITWTSERAIALTMTEETAERRLAVLADLGMDECVIVAK